MILKKNSAIVSIILFAIFFLSAASFAENANDLKARMKARLPEINQLKASGIIGEGNDGLLAFVSGTSQKELVKAENDDRRKIYGAIAKQQRTTPAVVGSRRALQISQKADPGSWLQDSKGFWYKK